MSRVTTVFAATTFVASAICAIVSAADAAPIVSGSTLNFGGQSTCTSTSCAFGSAFVTSGTGSFNSFAFGTLATFSSVTFDPFTTGQIYSTVDSGGRIASFFATAQTARAITQTSGLTSYTFTDAGTARLTGFDDTPGFYLFTANQHGMIQGSFSATADTVSAAPEPATWTMLIGGLGIAGAALRRRRSGELKVQRA